MLLNLPFFVFSYLGSFIGSKLFFNFINTFLNCKMEKKGKQFKLDLGK